MSVAGGVANGVRQAFSHDAVANIHTRQTLGPLNPRPVGITASTSAALTGTTAALTVNLSGASPGGTVTFRVDGLYVGTATVTNGSARILLSGFLPGTYSVTASYAGDAANDPATFTYTVKIQELSWLPAVLDLILN